MSDERRERVVAARLRLMERFKGAIEATPGRADGAPQGEGPPNRHGMPRLPVGQVETDKWPVLDLGHHPQIPKEKWRLKVDGAVASPLVLRFDELLALEQVDDVSDFHCVTTWSRMDLRWRGVRVSTVLALADPKPEATHLMAYGSDGYSTNLPLVEALKDDVLLAHAAEGAPLPLEHGGPVRMITPQLYAWKGSKWIKRLEVMVGDRPGFWEERGYSMSAHPWRNDRYR
jgi:DMSO/TMAO reductase YedYZ molybdopterin-dependent catalytic subunit